MAGFGWCDIPNSYVRNSPTVDLGVAWFVVTSALPRCFTPLSVCRNLGSAEVFYTVKRELYFTSSGGIHPWCSETEA